MPTVGKSGEKPPASPFGRRLRSARRAAGLTLARLSDRVGMAIPNLHELETSPAANPTLRTIERLAAALECSVPELVTYQSDNTLGR